MRLATTARFLAFERNCVHLGISYSIRFTLRRDVDLDSTAGCSNDRGTRSPITECRAARAHVHVLTTTCSCASIHRADKLSLIRAVPISSFKSRSCPFRGVINVLWKLDTASDLLVKPRSSALVISNYTNTIRQSLKHIYGTKNKSRDRFRDTINE